METTRIRLLVLDDHILFREGLVRLLGTEPDFEIAGHCGTFAEGLEMLQRLAVDVLLLDFRLDGAFGNAFISAARDAGYTGKVLMVTARMDAKDCFQALRLGASGIFLKHNPPSLLIRVIRMIAAEDVWMDPKIIQIMAESVPGPEEALHPELNDRERQVLQGVLEGLTNQKIGVRLGMTEGSVKSVLQQLFRKMGVRTRSQLVRAVLQGSGAGK